MPEAILRQRHTLVWADPSAWHALCSSSTQLPADWASRHRPLVVRRRLDTDPVADVPLGLPLPPAQGKKRLFAALPPNALHDAQPMPALYCARRCAPAHWQSTIDRILTAAPETRVFGSLAWEYLTGLPYLSSTSDLDLLFDMPISLHAWRALNRQLLDIDSHTTLRVDGECVRADGAAVKWREFASDSPQVLVKTRDAMDLMPRDDFLRQTFET